MTKKEIYLAGGCFWGTQHFMKLINGVIDSEVGFANSIVANPSYKTVCTGSTNAAETVKVTYDADKVSLSTLLKLFFMTSTLLPSTNRVATAALNTARGYTTRRTTTAKRYQTNLPSFKKATTSHWP